MYEVVRRQGDCNVLIGTGTCAVIIPPNPLTHPNLEKPSKRPKTMHRHVEAPSPKTNTTSEWEVKGLDFRA